MVTTGCCQTDLFIAKLVRADPRSWEEDWDTTSRLLLASVACVWLQMFVSLFVDVYVGDAGDHVLAAGQAGLGGDISLFLLSGPRGSAQS